MREALEKEINRKVGRTYGSAEIKQLRNELVSGALERYDDELASGALPEAAYSTALDSLGDISELLKSCGVDEKRKRRRLALAIPLLLLLLVPVIACAALIENNTAMIFFLIIGLIAVGLTAYGVLSLITRSGKKPLSIVSIAIGSTICSTLAYSALMLIFGTIVEQDDKRFDYTGDIDTISSISIIRVSGDYYSSTMEDDFKYTVVKDIDREEWAKLLSEIAELKFYLPFGDPPSVNADELMVMIRFSPSKDGMTCALIGQKCPGYGERVDSRVRLYFYSYLCKETDWDSVIKKYLD
ncbi:MAG: hypothetical protein IKP26_08760 [Clostridia bacterium]|nr:hypothetical protein [Clostridia bacterium]